MVLRMKSLAHSIKAESWLKGQPVANFQPRMYNVEWATLSGRCAAAMLRLVQLQQEYKDDDLDVVENAANERAAINNAQTKCGAWLTEKFSKMSYATAFDSTGEMNQLWMESSFAPGISTSFVLDRHGDIAFIGHSMRLAGVLPKVLQAIWRIRDEGEAADAKRIAESQFVASRRAVNVACFVALKVGLDEAMPEVQISLFCAFGLDAVDFSEIQIMSGQHEHPDRRRVNSSRDYVDTYSVESQRAAMPGIGSGSTPAVRGVAITACKKRLQPAPILRCPSA
ncbi:hypothetical protein IVB04_38365 [Bradyrhizobium sp. 169]|nr:hypothetical protein [Bradyrhizobium sp. 169]MCK1592873.1 hypothetical protein [Bradyrhizobium sp. 169]